MYLTATLTQYLAEVHTFELELECNGVDMPTYDTHHLLPRNNEPATAAPREGLFARTKLKLRCFSVVWMGGSSIV